MRYPRIATWLIFILATLIGTFTWTTIIRGNYMNQFLGESLFSGIIFGMVLLANWYWQRRKQAHHQ
ncbi:hypothetical protein FC98_GL001151 [Lentilactobacillus kisonensis DSM 19906 = JCM 15041]|uniref:Uncharacterized protein n=1 Tax=Lentilactobacillus kisonensis DSM 19906 = JCM 15041 TaxID=1423766 RepID=A0A0R1NTU0_9LACO|nr:hypothetical protein FC98_GL001151 [Lentilactobacillus kisonensis DSM 19906 = JCM 15041]